MKDGEFADESNSLEQRKTGLLKVVKAHYERSRLAWGRKSRAHGDLNSYVCNWLWANGNKPSMSPAWSEKEKEVIDKLRAEFPPPANPMLAEGGSYWM